MKIIIFAFSLFYIVHSHAQETEGAKQVVEPTNSGAVDQVAKPVVDSNNVASNVKILPFSSQLSLGYLPEVGNTSASLVYLSSDLAASATVSNQLFFNYNSNASDVGLRLKHRITSQTTLGLSLTQTVSGSNVTKYSSAALGAGAVDSNVSKSGLEEPKISIIQILRENQNSRIQASLDLGIPMGADKPGSARVGGGSAGLELQLIKRMQKAELLFGIGYTGYEKLKYESDTGTKIETKGKGTLNLSVGTNLFVGEELAVGVGFLRSQYSAETNTYSSGAQDLKTDAYGANGIILGMSFAFDEVTSLTAAFNTYRIEESDSTQGTTVITQEEGTAKTGTFGILMEF